MQYALLDDRRQTADGRCWSAYTMVEILIAVTLSLLLLLGVTQMFRQVGTMIDDTTSSQNMTATMNEVSLVLRNDLAGIDPQLAHQPYNMVTQGSNYSGDVGGYLEIIEGMNAPYSEINANHQGLHIAMKDIAKNSETNAPDLTVGDLDDILAFTAKGTSGKFRGLIGGSPAKSDFAEIVYFVRGTTLYRRVLLIPEPPERTFTSYTVDDLSIRGDRTVNTKLADFSDRKNRFAHHYNNANLQYPFPLYYADKTTPANDRENWYFLRLPTLEEQTSDGTDSSTQWTLGSLPASTFAPTATDFWEKPYGESGVLHPVTGALTGYRLKERKDWKDKEFRAYKDIVLKNVLSFDVKVWNPYWVPCRLISDTSKTFYAAPQFVDLGQDVLKDINGEEGSVIYTDSLTGTQSGDINIKDIPDQRGYGFVLKGRYNSSSKNRRMYDDKWAKEERLSTGASDNQLWTGPAMPCVFDSWTKEYEIDPSKVGRTKSVNYSETDAGTWCCPPPYSEDLKAVQITIRCFDPRSRQIKQVQVVHRFGE